MFKHSFECLLFFGCFLLFVPRSQAQVVIEVPQDFALIQDAIDNASEGDTIVVDSGRYVDPLEIDKTLHLLGRPDAEKPVIDLLELELAPGQHGIKITADSSGSVAGFELIAGGNFDAGQAGIGIYANEWEVRDNSIMGFHFGISAYDLSGEIYHTKNQIINNYITANTVGIFAGFDSFVAQNILKENERGVQACEFTVIENNLLINHLDAVYSLICDGRNANLTIRNNTIAATTLSGFGSQQTGILLRTGDGISNDSFVENNIVYDSGREGIRQAGPSDASLMAFTIQYNNVHLNSVNYDDIEDQTGINGNVSIEPFFADNDDVYYLQSDSPLIDTGNPEIVDPDGSRSDLGMFGGPNAPPLMYAPSSFDLTEPADSAVVNPLIRFSWEAPTDKDPDDDVTYRVVLTKDTTRFNLTLQTPYDTLYTDTNTLEAQITGTPGTYRWTVDALDNAGLYTRSSSQHIMFLPSGIGIAADALPVENVILGVWPNPFVSELNIQYQLAIPTRSKISIHDLLGREVAMVSDRAQSAGVHLATWKPEGIALATGVYFVRIEIDGQRLHRSILFAK